MKQALIDKNKTETFCESITAPNGTYDQVHEKIDTMIKDCKTHLYKEALIKVKNLVFQPNSPLRDKYDQLMKEARTDVQTICHHDVQPYNLLVTDDKVIVLIDFEFASFAYRAVDLASYLIETSYDYTTREFHPENCLSIAA